MINLIEDLFAYDYILSVCTRFFWYEMVWTAWLCGWSKYCWTKQYLVLQTVIWQSITLWHPCSRFFALISLFQTHPFYTTSISDFLNWLANFSSSKLDSCSVEMTDFAPMWNHVNWVRELPIDFLSNGSVALIKSDVLMISLGQMCVAVVSTLNAVPVGNKGLLWVYASCVSTYTAFVVIYLVVFKRFLL